MTLGFSVASQLAARLRLAFDYGYRHPFRQALFILIDSAHARHTGAGTYASRVPDRRDGSAAGGFRSRGGGGAVSAAQPEGRGVRSACSRMAKRVFGLALKTSLPPGAGLAPGNQFDGSAVDFMQPCGQSPLARQPPRHHPRRYRDSPGANHPGRLPLPGAAEARPSKDRQRPLPALNHKRIRFRCEEWGSHGPLAPLVSLPPSSRSPDQCPAPYERLFRASDDAGKWLMYGGDTVNLL